jgi:hypothetical protein
MTTRESAVDSPVATWASTLLDVFHSNMGIDPNNLLINRVGS